METLKTVSTKKKTKLAKTETDSGSSANLEQFATLKEEVRRGIMPERKKVALLSKLTGLFSENSLDENEVELMKMILVKERAKGIISSSNTDLLNSIERETCDSQCYVKTDSAPVVLKLTKDKVCDYKFVDELGKDGDGRFVVYVPDVVTSLSQLDMATASRIANGHDIDESKLKPERTIWRRLELKRSEFEKWFGYNDEEILGNKTASEELEYKF